MSRIACFVMAVWLGLCLADINAASVHAASEMFAPPRSAEVRSKVVAWLADQHATDEQREQINDIWSNLEESVAPERMLDLVVRSFSIVDPGTRQLVQDCVAIYPHALAPVATSVLKPIHQPFFLANISLYYGRNLVERRLFDEAWDVLKSIDAVQVVDPASLFFFQAVSAQGMLELKPALEAIDQLLKNTERVPVRYSATAVLMQADLQSLQEKSLGEIARLMADSERRLDLGRAGEKVQGVQERIVANLDEIIKKIEQQQSGGGGGSGEGGNNNNPANGADDSSVKGEEGPGDSDKKRFSNKGSWGNLPEKDLAKAKNDLNKNFPSHYEQAIEKYTRKLAGRAAKKSK